MGLQFSRKIFEKHQIPNFTKIHPVGAQFLHASGWTDGQTDMTKLMVAFRNFANEPKILHSSQAVQFCLLLLSCNYFATQY